jgi:hypothetical protein
MDKWIGHWNSSSFGTLTERIPQLQTAFESWAKRFEGFAKVKALALSLCAIAMGILAYNTCCEETSLAWVKSHFPSQTIWQASLSSEGLQLVKDPKILARALKNLPARVETGNQAWEGKLDGASSWWVIYPGKGQSDPLLFCRNCDQIPKKWQPVGEGWAALDTVLAQIKVRLPSLVAKGDPKRVETLDPREIRY